MVYLACLALAMASLSAFCFLRNLSLYRRPGQTARHSSLPISVLIPARNEALNIAGVLTSVLANTNVQFEVVVANDHSEDDTAAIVRSFAEQDPRVRLISNPPLPEGWNGKQHACHCLARAATNSILCFIDADVRLAPNALATLSGLMLQCEAALISGIPRQITKSWLEKLQIPLIHFILLGYLPIDRMRASTDPAYAAGCGQLFVARKDSYERCGGHAAIRSTMHDGIKLPAAFRKAGFKTDLFDATEVASVRMYAGAREVWAGLSKNATEGMATAKLLPLFTTFLFAGHVLPFVLLPIALASHQLAASLIASAAVALSLLPRVLGILRFDQPVSSAVLHPVGVALLLVIQWVALCRKWMGKAPSWRGRSYPQQSSNAVV